MEKIRELWDEFRSGKPDGAIRQFLKYLVVGGGATLVEWALFWLLDAKLGLHHQWATVIAYAVSTFANWGFGRLLVFKKSERGAAAEIAGVYLAAAVGLLLNMGIMFVLVDVLEEPPALLTAVAIALSVFAPATPSAVRPFAFWKALTAASVLLPKLPVISA